MIALNTLSTGISFGESARWHEGRFWFCDWGTGEVIALAADGRRELIAVIPTAPLSIDWRSDGRMLIVAGGERRVVQLTLDGVVEPVVDLRPIADFPWNEIVVNGRGQAYVNSIGIEFGQGDPIGAGMIALLDADGSVRQVAGGLSFPNGMAVTPDHRHLIVAESFGGCLTAFDIAPDGGLSNRRIWADLGGGAPDGICLDAEGAIWYADVPNQCCVRVREGGEVLQTISLDRGCFSCALGGDHGRTLYMLARDWGGPENMFRPERTGVIYSVEVASPGIQVHPAVDVRERRDV